MDRRNKSNGKSDESSTYKSSNTRNDKSGSDNWKGAGRNQQGSHVNSRKRVNYFWPEVCKHLEKFTYFFRFDSPFSQHHPARFQLDRMHFNCSEQFYMYQKAVTFHDKCRANKIMETSEPPKQKSIAKGIPNFDQKIWDEVSYDIVTRANIAKFDQNKRLLNLLVATRGTELVEASMRDHKWGIGLESDQADALRKETWRGENKLGRILTEIRDNYFGKVEYEPELGTHDKYYGYLYFWKSSPFSPKYLSPFSDGERSFVSLFHYLMFKSAEMSGKKQTADVIAKEMRQHLIEKSAYSEDINEQLWEASLKNYLIQGNFYKFKDNPNLKALLLGTNGKMLVFQSQFENIGNGLDEKDVNVSNVISSDWKNNNLLGLILTNMRDNWIKNPKETLEEFLNKSTNMFIPNCGLKDIDKMHMRGCEPPELPKYTGQMLKETSKMDDDGMWECDTASMATTTNDLSRADVSKKIPPTLESGKISESSNEPSRDKCSKPSNKSVNQDPHEMKDRLPSTSNVEKKKKTDNINVYTYNFKSEINEKKSFSQKKREKRQRKKDKNRI